MVGFTPMVRFHFPPAGFFPDHRPHGIRLALAPSEFPGNDDFFEPPKLTVEKVDTKKYTPKQNLTCPLKKKEQILKRSI